LSVSGCPVTDDYYLLPSDVQVGGSDEGAAGSPNGSKGGNGGEAALAGAQAGDGVADAGAAMTLVGGAGGAVCAESGDERCDGRDNDCDGSVDEGACIDGCQGFVLAGQPEHGYAYCDISAAQDWESARDACLAGGMRLLWLESAAENDAISAKLAALGDDAEITFGANDLETEGDWRWGPNEPFWRGDGDGRALGDAFTAWTEGVPNDNDGDEDCGVLYPDTATWGDKACDQQFAYACEQAD
jgi:hypothetical protein